MLTRCVRRNERLILSASFTPLSLCLRGGLSQGEISFPTKRHAATKGRAPSTIDRSYRIPSLTPAEVKQREQVDRQIDKLFEESCGELFASGFLKCRPDDAVKFISDFKTLYQKTKTPLQPFANPELFVELLEFYNVTFDDAEVLARNLLSVFTDSKAVGKAILYSLSRAGYLNATIRILVSALMTHTTSSPNLRSREIFWVRDHLKQVANEPGSTDFRAMTLEGKIALALREPKYAIEMWTKAIDAAVDASEKRRANPQTQKGPGRGVTTAHLQERDSLELSAPWIDLMMLYRHQGDYDAFEWAMSIGCEQDDPTAHLYQASHIADQELASLGEGEVARPVLGAWLFHITKAATSGVARAAHELGLFYLKVGWKYLKDEPPDHLKPTPFDSYPAPFSAATAYDRIRQFVGLQSKTPVTQQESVFRSAHWPFDPYQRQIMAILWLKEACSAGYLPAYLSMARLCMAKTLWDGLAVPQSARDLSPERYRYSSKAEFEAATARDPWEDADGTEIEKPAKSPLRHKRSLHYSPENAKSWLREIFYCHSAHQQMRLIVKHHDQEVRRGNTSKKSDEDSVISETYLSQQGMPPHFTKWFRNREVREQYEDRLQDMWLEAKRICDVKKWRIYDEQGGYVYSAKL